MMAPGRRLSFLDFPALSGLAPRPGQVCKVGGAFRRGGLSTYERPREAQNDHVRGVAAWQARARVHVYCTRTRVLLIGTVGLPVHPYPARVGFVAHSTG